LKRLGAVEHYLEPKLLVRLRLEDGLRPWKDKTGQHSKTLFLKYIKIIIRRKNLNNDGCTVSMGWKTQLYSDVNTP
jgi:hypothetical protein